MIYNNLPRSEAAQQLVDNLVRWNDKAKLGDTLWLPHDDATMNHLIEISLRTFDALIWTPWVADCQTGDMMVRNRAGDRRFIKAETSPRRTKARYEPEDLITTSAELAFELNQKLLIREDCPVSVVVYTLAELVQKHNPTKWKEEEGMCHCFGNMIKIRYAALTQRP